MYTRVTSGKKTEKHGNPGNPALETDLVRGYI